MKRTAVFLAVTLTLAASGLLHAQSSPAVPEPKAPKMFDLNALDKSADPCQNFYQYACGNWRKENPVPADQSNWGRFNELNERNRWLTYQILLKAEDPSASRTPLQQKFGDYFAACMNEAQVNAAGDKPVQPLLARIAALKDRSQIEPMIAELQSKNATRVLFNFGSTQDTKNSAEQIAEIGQGGLGLPDRDYYIADDDRSKKIRDEYVEHVTNMFKLLGDSPEEAAREAKLVLKFETSLAGASQTRVARRLPENTYHRMTVAEVQKLSPSFDWNQYFVQVGAPPLSNNITVESPDFVKEVGEAVANADMAEWRSYLRWQVVHSAAPWLSDQFADENFNFYGKTLAGQKEQQARWKRCTQLTDRSLGEAVGQDWVATNFPAQSKANMQKLVAALDQALNEDIQQLDWMTPATKAEAEKKLAAIRNKIGYPDKWRDYSSVEVTRDNLIADIHHASAFEFRRQLNKIGKPVDETEWGMSPPTVNAYYNSSMNDINFPAGILQPPFYSASATAAEDFGGIGAVIGHEMTHGFDDQGSKFDGAGNMREWYTAEDRKGFVQRTDCEVDEYNGFEPVPGQKLNGNLTLGENTADNGGVRIAYRALLDTLAKDPSAGPDVDGFTPAQQFFISYGQIWCENTREEFARLMARTNEHSPGEFRVNGVLRNFDQFGNAFHCKPGGPMTPAKGCRVW